MKNLIAFALILFTLNVATAQTSQEIKYPNGVNYWASCSGPAKHTSATLYGTAVNQYNDGPAFVVTAFSSDMDVLQTTVLKGATVAVCGGMLKVTDSEGFVHMFYDRAKPQ